MSGHLHRPEFVSYSANLEDVMLRRLFRDVAEGFFVDVGAAHPVFENDTKALYDRGWRGINVEPNEDFLDALRRERPGDLNVGGVVSDRPGEAVFYKVVDTGLSTVEAENAERASSQGYRIEKRHVAAMTLAQILDEAKAPAEFELLKVDVEGAERAVLAGNDWSRFRPRIIVAEGTSPELPARRDDGVREFLAGLGWRHVWFDGLNDWYAAAGYEPPAGAFDAPPNVFDRYVTRRTFEAEEQVRWLEQTLAERERAIETLRTQDAEPRGMPAEPAEAEISRLVKEASRLRNLVASFAHEQDAHRRTLAILQDELAAARREIADAASRADDQVRRERSQHQEQGEARLQALQQVVDTMRSSTSWRVSAPVRIIGRLLKR